MYIENIGDQSLTSEFLIVDNFIFQGYPVFLRDANFKRVSNIVETIGPWQFMTFKIYEREQLKWSSNNNTNYSLILRLTTDYDDLVNGYKLGFKNYKYKQIENKLYKIPKNNFVAIELAPPDLPLWYYFLTNELCQDVSLLILNQYLYLFRKNYLKID